MTIVHDGLEGLVVARTSLSKVDGELGTLLIAGSPVQELASLGVQATMEALWSRAGLAPPGDLGEARLKHWDAWQRLGPMPTSTSLATVRTLVSMFPCARPVDLVAAVGVATAICVRTGRGEAPIAPDPSLDHGADLMRMSGFEPLHALEAYLVTVCDHGLNASTFTARVVASTGADDLSVVTAALAALSGPLHGGAPGPVLDMLDAVAEADPEPWIRSELAAGRRIMGMGHRVYRVRDPRVTVLQEVAATLPHAAPTLARARGLEETAARVLAEHRPGRALHANVELATAVLLDALGFPREAFTCLFASGRVLGWLAHAAEQRRTGRLMRPRAVYVG